MKKHLSLCVYTIILAVVAAGSSSRSASEFHQFTPIADATISSQSPSQNFGLEWSVSIERDEPNDLNSGLIQFDLSSLQGRTVDVANFTVRAYISLSSGGNPGLPIELYRVVSPWVENEVTWNSASSGNPWTPGGDYVGTTGVRDVLPYASISPTVADNFVTFDLTYVVTDLAQAWLRGDVPNYGLRDPMTEMGWV